MQPADAGPPDQQDASVEPTPQADAPPPSTTITPEQLEAYEQEKHARERKDPKKWRHKGLILEFMLGTQGCTGSYCRDADNLDATPGFRIAGLIGRNSLGILDFGLELGWGTLNPGEINGRFATDIYDLDPVRLEQLINDRLGIDLAEFDLSQAVTTTAKLRTANAGPTLRIHVLPRGRYDPYVGAGFHYLLWRARYETLSGPARLDFHGFAVPLQVGFNVFVHPNIAVGARFDYSFTYYFLAHLDHPDASGVTIVSTLDDAAIDVTVDNPTQKGLPKFWALLFGARARF